MLLGVSCACLSESNAFPANIGDFGRDQIERHPDFIQMLTGPCCCTQVDALCRGSDLHSAAHALCWDMLNCIFPELEQTALKG